MEEGNLAILVDAKSEYTKQLINILKSNIYNGIRIIYQDAKSYCLENDELENTFWEIETGEFLSKDQINELEENRKSLISKLDISKKDQKTGIVFKTIITFCKNYEELCKKKYPEAPLPLEILKSIN